ncbi:GNAT family N-acetyltransferase [Methylomonas sp. AM2-LC]|uniref:GNAT family N-acetyltransferase n=1 Tax=Methylomonas sp. AM2-LC TaxID=3153301 RepID=UPI0032644DF7
MQTRTHIRFSSVTINGVRVKLIPIADQYADIIFKEFTDEITQFMVPSTPTHINQIYEFIRASNKKMEENTDLTFAILDNTSDEFLGVCGLHGKPSPDEPSLGIWLKKQAHGNRFGQEAIKILANWARENLIFSFMVYPCDRDNIPSRKIAEKLNGRIFRTGKVTSMSGRILNEVAYKIV